MSRIRPRSSLSRWSILIGTCGALALFASGALTTSETPITGAPKGWTPPAPSAALTPPPFAEIPDAEADEAKWINGELAAPLPRDPDRRRAAIEQARANGAAQVMPVPGVEHTIGARVSDDAPLGGSRSTNDKLPFVEPYIPAEVRNGDKTWNLKLPDQFVADPALVRGIDPDTGEPMNLAQQVEAFSAALAPALSQSWESIAQTPLTPPDCDVAAGPSNVLAVVNARFAIYDKCGNNQYENNIATFVGNGTDFFFDPKVIFDEWSQRWFITCCVRNNTTLNSWVILLWSDDSEALGAWNFLYFDFRNLGVASNFWADYQDIGTDLNGIYITANMFDWSTPNRIFQYSKLLCIDTSDLLAGAWCGWVFWGMNNPADGTETFSIRPTTMHTWPGFHWLVNSVSFGGSFLSLWKVQGDICSGPTLTGYNIPVALYDNPPAALQPNGTYVDCGDARLMNAVYQSANLWTGHAIRYNWGEPTDRSNLQVFQFNPNTLAVAFQTSVGSPGLYFAYPAVDFDGSNNGIVAFSIAGPAFNPSSQYIDLGNGGPWGGGTGALAFGNTSYTGSADAGTLADPYRWGDYYGAAIDPTDYRTLWIYGQYTVDAFNWGTRVGATAPQGAGVLSVTPSPGLASGGLQGGPFAPAGINYTVSNTGGSALTWTLAGVDAWNTASSTGGQLGPGGSTVVSVNINAGANAFAPGVHTDSYTFTNCYNGAALARSTTLHVGADGSCDGSVLSLAPDLAPPNFGADGSTVERGVYVTAIKDFRVCSLGYKLQLSSLPRTLTARIYAANGNTRGALLASASIAIAEQGNVTHYVPLNYTLQACQDYELVFVITAGDAWEWWNENLIAEPFDVGGAIRVRCGSLGGGGANFALPHINVIGFGVPSPAMVTDLGPATTPNSAGDDNQERGIYIKALETAQLCSFGWEADLPLGTELTARVYRATGIVRGAVLAEGTYTVTASGLQFHDVPVNAQLEEGHDYDLAISFGVTNSWPYWNEPSLTEPYDADVFRVVDAEYFGAASNTALPHYRATWEEKTGGSPWDMKKLTDVFPPPNTTGQDNSSYGAYVTSNINQQVYSVGWMADVPPGQPITANVYEAVGTVRGALISTGTVFSTAGGMQWYDVPVAVEMLAGQDYDISITWATVTEWLWWWDTSGMPFTINGVLTVRDGEANGGAGNGALLHMRICACDEYATPVLDSPQRTPFFIATPSPNPIATTARLDFSLEEDAPVTITVYDVAGRRVATLLDNQHTLRGRHSIDLNSTGFASGVYFLKMQTPAKSLARKFVVMH